MSEAFETILDAFASGELTVEELRIIKEAVDEKMLPLLPPHATSDPRVLKVGGKRINVIATGLTQKVQLAAIQDWMKRYLLPHLDGVEFTEEANLHSVATTFTALLDSEALVKLGMIITREDKKFVEENFDLSWIVDGAAALVHYHQKKTGMKLWLNQQK